jgi:hypothetical protein
VGLIFVYGPIISNSRIIGKEGLEQSKFAVFDTPILLDYYESVVSSPDTF